jgi:hypothetical protein
MANYQVINISQGGDCTKFTINDDTDYGVGAAPAKLSVTSRLLRIGLSDGTYIGLDGKVIVSPASEYIDFPINGANPDFLEVVSVPSDLSIRVELTIAYGASVDTEEVVVALVCHTLSGFYVRTQRMANSPKLQGNVDYVRDTMRLFIESESAKKAANEADHLSAQNSLDRAKYIIDNDFS